MREFSADNRQDCLVQTTRRREVLINRPAARLCKCCMTNSSVRAVSSASVQTKIWKYIAELRTTLKNAVMNLKLNNSLYFYNMSKWGLSFETRQEMNYGEGWRGKVEGRACFLS